MFNNNRPSLASGVAKSQSMRSKLMPSSPSLGHCSDVEDSPVPEVSC